MRRQVDFNNPRPPRIYTVPDRIATRSRLERQHHRQQQREQQLRAGKYSVLRATQGCVNRFLALPGLKGEFTQLILHLLLNSVMERSLEAAGKTTADLVISQHHAREREGVSSLRGLLVETDWLAGRGKETESR